MDALSNESLQVFVRRLCPAELHLHLEGSVDINTLRELDPDFDEAQYRDHLHFKEFAGFLRCYVLVTRLLNTPAAYALATRHLLERLARDDVRYAEITLSAGVVLWKGESLEETFAAIQEECARCTAVRTAWIFDAIRQFGPEPAAAVFHSARELKDRGVVAIGLGGDEVRGPAPLFSRLYQECAEAGLRLTCHAGETAGPESVREALAIGSERIGHGFRAAEDPALLEDLRERNVPLEVCLSSNVRTGVLSQISDHPLRLILDAGVPVVLGSDDPALFATDLHREYLIAANHFGLSRQELTTIARNSHQYAFIGH